MFIKSLINTVYFFSVMISVSLIVYKYTIEIFMQTEKKTKTIIFNLYSKRFIFTICTVKKYTIKKLQICEELYT